MSSKVTIAVASKALGLHPNTFKNWIKAGKLPGAEKVKPEKGVALWLIDLEEVKQVLSHGAAVFEAGTFEAAAAGPGGPVPDYTQYETTNQTTAQLNQIGPDVVGLAFRESIVAPLTQLIKEQGKEIAELRETKGMMAERIRNLELRLQESEASHKGAIDSATGHGIDYSLAASSGPPGASGGAGVKVAWWRRLLGG